ncbi:MAG: hypothetical protein JWM61_2436 [Micrococcaceae bacterium]|nr:hypothetical protein [Micrococcaceae bacterium]
MRWDALFNDLESQLHSATTAQQESEIRDRTRSEQARLTLVQRLVGQVGRPLGLTTHGGRTITGNLTNVGSEWIAVVVDDRSVIVPLSSLLVLRGPSRNVGQPLAGVAARLGLGSVLRVLSRDRANVSLWLAMAPSPHAGFIERVGADFFELGLVAPGDSRQPSSKRDVLTVPFDSIDSIDSARFAD